MRAHKRKQSWTIEHEPDSKTRGKDKNGYDNQTLVNDDVESAKIGSSTLMHK